MEIGKFVMGTVKKMNESCFESLKGKLIGEYIKFSALDKNMISIDCFSEKLCDYFEKLELKTSAGFDDLIKKYVNDWDVLVENKVAMEAVGGKTDIKSISSRARKYYSHAQKFRGSSNITIKQLTDYSRIMMCLYMAIINKHFQKINDFDYSVKCLDIEKIVDAMRLKRSKGFLGMGKGAKFDTADQYSLDRGVFILTIIMYYHIKSSSVEGEY